MKKTLLYLALLLSGIGIGYLLNNNLDTTAKDEKNIDHQPEKVYIEKIKKEMIRDTIEIEKIVSVPVKKTPISPSTDTLHPTDTMSTKQKEEVLVNQTKNKEEIIITEELIAQRTIPLYYAPNDSSDVAEMLNLKTTAFADEMSIEFWQSPLNITGYELTRNRLKLFGFNPRESISLHLDKVEDQLLLDTESMSIVLKKSKQFKTLKLK